MLGAFRRPRQPRIDMRQCTTAPDGAPLDAPGGPLAGAVLVGGAVRDLLLGRPLTDLDWLVADPRGSAEALARALDGSLVALDPGRGQWRVVAYGRCWDLVAPEPEAGAQKGQTTEAGADPLDDRVLTRDLWRRDLTINALAALPDGRVVDPTGGLGDLRARVVRLTSGEVLSADPLRAYRAVRLAAQLGFRLDEESAALIAELARTFGPGGRPLPAVERLQGELSATLQSPVAGRAMAAMDELGLLAPVLPELTAGRGMQQGPLHHLDVLQHQLEALQRLVDAFPDAAPALRWATLLHDVGKPLTLQHEEGDRPRFHGHDVVGAEVAARALRRLRLPNAVQERVAALIRAHMRPLPRGERSARRFVHRLRPLLPDLLRLMVADREAARGPLASEAQRQRYRLALADVIRRLESQPAAAVPLLDGRDVMRMLGLAPGPAVGEALRAVEEAVAVGEVTDREEAEAYLRHMAAVRGWPLDEAASPDVQRERPTSEQREGAPGEQHETGGG